MIDDSTLAAWEKNVREGVYTSVHYVGDRLQEAIAEIRRLRDQAATQQEHFDLAPHVRCRCLVCESLMEIRRLREQMKEHDVCHGLLIACTNSGDALVECGPHKYARQQVKEARLDWSCPLCHCCGEKRHDGDDPCISCKTAVEAALEQAAQIVDQWACSTTCDSTGAPCEHIRVAVTIAATIRALKAPE